MVFDPKIIKLGKLPARIPKNLKYMNEHIEHSLGIMTLPPTPRVRRWSRGHTKWGEMLNDQLGACTCAGIGHYFQVATLDESILTDHYFHMQTASDNVVLKLYENAANYNPNASKVWSQEENNWVNSTDNGAECSAILQYVTNNGFNGHKVYGFGLVDQNVQSHVMEMINLFGGMYIGLQLPKTCEGQIFNGVWDVVDSSLQGNSKPGSYGGHCVFVPDYVDNGSELETLTCITWGGLQKMTWKFFATYCDEAYCILSDAWVASGKSPLGFDLASLQANMSELVHEL